ncbi:MAG TPA: pitrilysin family protein [Longimicrobiales bacterium]
MSNDVVYQRLGNGVHLLVKQRSHLPLVSVAIGARGGALLEPRDQAGVTAMMARTSIKGTQRRTAASIADEAERMGGSISPYGGSDLLDWEISVPSRHFEKAFDLLADVAFNAQFPEPELEVERKLTIAGLQHTRDDMYRYPLQLCMQAAFAGHPYGYSLDDLERGVTQMQSEQLRVWQKERMTAEPWVMIVGDIDAATASRQVEKLSGVGATTQPRSGERPHWPATPISIREQRDKAQSALAIGFPGPHRNHEDVYALQVMANAVGGLGGRFFEELRSKRSLAYTVSLIRVFRALAGTFVGYIATTPEREDEARAGLYEQFATLVDAPLSDEEIERSKRYTIGAWQIRNQTNASQLSDLLQAHLLGSGMDEIDNFEARIRAVTASAIQEVAARYFKPELAVEGIVRGNHG